MNIISDLCADSIICELDPACALLVIFRVGMGDVLVYFLEQLSDSCLRNLHCLYSCMIDLICVFVI